MNSGRACFLSFAGARNRKVGLLWLPCLLAVLGRQLGIAAAEDPATFSSKHNGSVAMKEYENTTVKLPRQMNQKFLEDCKCLPFPPKSM